MTISNTIRTAGPFIGNGITTAFPFTFKVFKKEEVLAVQTDVATGVATPLVLNSGYSVVLNADQNASPGGTATTTAPLAAGQTLVLTSDLAYLQPLDITNGGGFYPSVLNAALDRLTIFCQQLFGLARRSIKFPLSDAGMNTELPSAVARANKLLGFDASGRPIVAAPVSGSAAEVAIDLANAIAAYAAPSGARLIGLTPAGSVGGATSTTVEKYVQKTLPRSVFDFMTDAEINDVLSGALLIDVGAKVQTAIDAFGNGAKIIIPNGRYNMGGTPISIGTGTNSSYLFGEGLPELVWYSLPTGTDAITMNGGGYTRQGIENLKISMNFSGRHGVNLAAGDHPYIRNIQIDQPFVDGVSVYCDGYSWVENLEMSDVVVNQSGRHFFSFVTIGNLGSFINESRFVGLEGRSCSLKANGGCAIYMGAFGNSGNKISEMHFQSCNFDANRAASVAAGFDIGPNPVLLDYVPFQTNTYERLTFDGGAWESISQSDFRAAGAVHLADGASATGCVFYLGVDSGWSTGGISGNFQGYELKRFLGPWRTPYPNSWKQQLLGASAFYSFDVPFSVVPNGGGGRTQQGAVYELTLFAQRFAGADMQAIKQDIYLKFFNLGTDSYWSFIPPQVIQSSGTTLFTLNSVTVIDFSGGIVLNGATPAWGVRCALATSAAWGSGGGDAQLHAVMAYKGGTHGDYSF